MSDETKALLERAMRLAPKERAELAARLVASVNALSDVEAAWTALIQGRAKRVLAQELGTTTYLRNPPANTVRFEIDAEVDLERAATWYENEAGRVAAFLAEVQEAIDQVIANPAGFGFHTGLPGLGVRRVYLREFPYTMPFVRIRGTQLRILGVVHSYRSPAEGEISVAALIDVEEWLTAHGVRALSTLPGLAALTLGATQLS